MKHTIKRNKIAALTIVFSLVLVLLGVLITNWMYTAEYITMRTTIPISTQIMLSVGFLILPICLSYLTVQIVSYFRTEKALRRTSGIIYLAIIIFTLMALLLNNNSEKMNLYVNIIVLALYVPALYAFSVIPASYLICRTENEIWKFISIVLALLFIPVCSMFCFRGGFDIVIELGIILLALLVKLSIDKELSHYYCIFLIAIITLIILLMVSLPGNFNDLSGTILKIGEDPETGWRFSEMIAALKQSKFIGLSDYYMNSASQTIPAYLGFASMGLIYLPLCLILRFGWIAGALPILLCVGLAGCFYRMSSKSGTNRFARYLTFSVGTYILGKMIIAYLACFVAPISGGLLPFCGRTSIIIDSVVCAFVAGVYRYREQIFIKIREPKLLRKQSPDMTEACYENMVNTVKEYHKHQFRSNSIPYAEHLFGVASILKSALETGKECDTKDYNDMYLAALGHDLIEDTTITEEEIILNSNERVLSLIKELSNPVDDAHTDEYMDQLADATEEARIVKYADLIENTLSVCYSYRDLGLKWVYEFYLPILTNTTSTLAQTDFIRYKKTAKFMRNELNACTELLFNRIENYDE